MVINLLKRLFIKPIIKKIMVDFIISYKICNFSIIISKKFLC